jgi:hypothetical protein
MKICIHSLLKWKDNIKMHFREPGCGNLHWVVSAGHSPNGKLL